MTHQQNIEAVQHVLGVIQTRLNEMQPHLANLGLVNLDAGFTAFNNVRFNVSAINEWQQIVVNDQHVVLAVMQVEGQPFTRVVRFIIQEHPDISYQIYLVRNPNQGDWFAYYHLHPQHMGPIGPIMTLREDPGNGQHVHSIDQWLYMCGRDQGEFGNFFKFQHEQFYKALQPSLNYVRYYISQVTAFAGWPQMFPQQVVQDYQNCMTRIQSYVKIVFDIPILMDTLVNNAFITKTDQHVEEADPPDWINQIPDHGPYPGGEYNEQYIVPQPGDPYPGGESDDDMDLDIERVEPPPGYQ